MTNGLKLLVIGCGCFFGGVLRYACEMISDRWLNPPFADPLAVLIVNAVGCFIIGLFTGWALKKIVPKDWHTIITTGFCGGLTTFSSFAQGVTVLFLAGHVWVGIFYILADMLLGLFAVYAGLFLVMGKDLGKELLK